MHACGRVRQPSKLCVGARVALRSLSVDLPPVLADVKRLSSVQAAVEVVEQLYRQLEGIQLSVCPDIIGIITCAAG